jgi:hypothetical protein
MTQHEHPERQQRRGWRSRAACRDVDPELFFPTAESGPARHAQVRAAKAVCARCPVRAQCLTEALARIPYGIAGGLTEHERRTLRRSDRHPTTGRTAAAVRAEVEAVLRDGPRPGLTARTAARERARVGQALLATDRTAGQVARACGVSTRTVQRWATPTTTGTGTTGSSTSAGGVGEGSRGGHRAPLGSPTSSTPRQGHDTAEGDRG